MLKINVGCGNDYVEGYVNIDVDKRFAPGIELEADMRNLQFDANSVDEIRAEGCIEHVSYREVPSMLTHWFTIMKPGGKLTIETPNLFAVMNKLAEDINNGNHFLGHAWETMWGGQRNPTEYHLALYDNITLNALLMLAGFSEIKFEKPTKNLGTSDDWNVRVTATKYHEWSFPGLSK